MALSDKQFKKIKKLDETFNTNICDMLDEVRTALGEEAETYLYWYIEICKNPSKRVPFSTLSYVTDEADEPHGHHISDAQYP